MNVAKRLLLVTATIAVAVAFGVLTGDVQVGAEGCARAGRQACPERPPAVLPQRDPMDCRDRVLYPSTKAAVHCVWITNGLGSQLDTLDYVIYRESRWDPSASNGSHFGLLQVWGGWCQCEGWFGPPAYLTRRYGSWADPVSNAAMGVYIFRLDGWRPWACC